MTQYTVDYVKDKIQGNPTEKSMMVDVEQFRRILRLELKEKTEENVLHAVEALQKREDILCAEPNYIYTIASTTPNDGYYTSGDQWGLDGTNGIQAPAAWDIKSGSAVTVGVMDTGIQADHPDLFCMISTKDLHRDCTVYPIQSEYYAYLSDPNGHGTHVAGIIGAEGDNIDENIGFNGGVSGVCWSSNLVSLRVFGSDGRGNESMIARAIDFAQEKNIPILNFSGGISYDYNSTILDALVDYTGLFVCAAGNSDSDNDSVPNYPSDYSRNQTFSSRVISVGAIKENGTRPTVLDWGYDEYGNPQGSNYGANSVSLFAPGDNIRSTYKNSQYADANGTSQATPFVTGVAALILSINPNLTPAQVKSAIMNNVDTSTALTGLCVSNGRLNAFKAVSSVAYNLTNVGTSSIRIDSLRTSLKTNNTAIIGPLSIPNTINGRTVTEIGSSAFVEARFTSLDIPSGVLSIASDSFEDCNHLNAINVASTNPNYSSTNGILYNKNCTTLLKYPASKLGSSFSVPASVTTIAYSAYMNCTNLQNVTVISEGNLTNTPDHTTSYQNYYYTERSLDVNLIAGSTYTLSFDYTNLSVVGDDGDDEDDDVVVYTSLGVGNTTFALDLPAQKVFPSNTSSGSQKIVFTPPADKLTTYTKLWCRFIRTNSPQTVSVYISNVKLERGVTDIDIHAFTGCTRLATPGLQYDLLANNTYAVSKGSASGTTLFIPSTYSGKAVTQIKASAFKNSSNFRWAFMQDSITTIGDRAFQFCYNLKIVDMSATAVTRIEDYTFDVCKQGTLESELKQIDLPDNLNYVGEGAFIRTKIPAVLPNNVTSIGAYAFAQGVDRIAGNLPTAVQTIGNYAFADCEALIMVYTGTQLTTIGQYAFFNTLTTLETIPSSVTTIGAYAFCNSLFPDLSLGGQLTTIGNYAFQNCQLRTLVLPTTITNIGVGAFNGNASLTIYTERSYTSTNPNWNGSNRPIVWGCTLSPDKTYVVSFSRSDQNPSYQNAVNGIKNPYREDYNFNGWYQYSDYTGEKHMDLATVSYMGTLYARWKEKSCVAEGTMITLADGSQVEVEDLTGEEQLLVWNLVTGTFDAAPILFIDSDPYAEYEIIHLYFSDGTEVEVIYEHGFWDIDLNEYIFLRNDAEQYIGHWFNKQTDDGNGNMVWTAVQLVDVEIYSQYTTAWSPVTFGHLCYYVNGMLSMPGATEGLINIFEVDAATMQYSAASFAADVATYGLFTYEEFAAIIPIPEVIFEAFNGQYLKVSIGKGLIDIEELVDLVERYADFFPQEDTNIPDDQNANGNGNSNHNGHGNGHGHGNPNGHANGHNNGHHRKGR